MSIRLRLALWYVAILGASLLAFGLTLYFLMAHHLDNMMDASIASRAEHVVAAIEARTSPTGPTLTLPQLDAFEAPGVYVQVLEANGAPLGSSANLAGLDLPRDEAALERARASQPATFMGSLAGSQLRNYLMAIQREGQGVAFVQVAMSTAQAEQTLDRLKLILIAGGVGALLLAGGVGWALAGRALRPIADIAEAARAIALSQGFSRRLEMTDSRDEVGLLAVTFNEMLASLDAAYAAQRRFVADASHELRAPLTTMRGNLDLLSRVKDMSQEERYRAVEDARHEAERLSRLVADLLSIAQADAGQRLPMETVELDVILTDVYRQALSLASGVEVSIEKLEPVMVSGDRDRLRQLLLIFADNALRYTPAGGRVALSLFREGDWAVLKVQDTGIGIEAQDLPHILDRFYRADNARARDPGGSGLGLAIAKWIVEELGGEILVESTPGSGSTFIARLPVTHT